MKWNQKKENLKKDIKNSKKSKKNEYFKKENENYFQKIVHDMYNPQKIIILHKNIKD